MLEHKRAEFVRLFQEFADTYPHTPDGKHHIVAYEEGRKQGRKNFDEIVAATDRGEDVADQVLLKLIPYRDSHAYREKGAWIHIAPATGDPRGRLKSQRPRDWKQAAVAILDFIRRCNEDSDQLAAACKDFSALPYSKGFQTGLLTPILSALRPDEFLLANGKSVRVINHFSDTNYGRSLLDYPNVNNAGHTLIDEVREELRRPGVAELRDADLFDMFSHWLVAIKKYFDGEVTTSPSIQTVLSWIKKLRTQASPDGRFHYKPLLLLALLNLLDADPEHPNSFQYEELAAAFEELAAKHGLAVTEDQFSQPYVRMRNDDSPLQVWISQITGTAQVDDSRANQPAYVRDNVPSVRVADAAWPAFASPEGREAIRHEINDRWPTARQYWWVNQGSTYRQERDGGYLWAPKEAKGGRVLSHHSNLLRVRTGDTILHYANGALRAVSEVLDSAKETPRPSELPAEAWNAEGYLVWVRYQELSSPIQLEDIPHDVRTTERGPFTRQGSVRQGYLFPLSSDFGDFVKRLAPEFPEYWPDILVLPKEQKKVWLFQANPKYVDLKQELEGVQPGGEDNWTVTRYRQEMRPGDAMILWQGGKEAGIYALGELIGEPYAYHYEGDAPSWIAGKNGGSGDHVTEWRVQFRYTKVLENPIYKSALLKDPALRHMQVIRAPQGTNFKVTAKEWAALCVRLEEKAQAQDYVEPPFDQILSTVLNQGIEISERALRRYHLGLKSRGFVILSGVTGTGKTWLTEAYAHAVGAKWLVVPVAPNWTTNEDLLGYFNPLDNKYHDTQFSRFLRKAAQEHQEAQAEGRRAIPYHLVLDEMNLARVEYYFAKFLSTMELRVRYGTAWIELGPEEQVLLPPNLRFAGTVNVDETTHSFADRVYDRAQLIELQPSREALSEHLGDVPYREVLIEIWDVAHPVAPFAFRTLDEISAYVTAAEEVGVTWKEAFDEQLLQKVLPKLKGADLRVGEALEWLVELTSEDFPLSNAKVKEMIAEFRHHGFASYF